MTNHDTKADAFEGSAAEGPFLRVSTGNPAADEILGGGFPANSINVVMGHPGAGKTIFVEELIFKNAGEGRPILYLTTLSEPLPKVIRYLQQFRFFDETRLGTAVVYEDIGTELAENGVSALVPRIRAAIEASGPKIIVIDSFKALHDIAESVSEMRRMLFELAGLLAAYETTAFFVGEYSDEHIPLFPEFAVADSIVQLTRRSQGVRDERFFRVLKLRGSSYLEGAHAFHITDAGLRIYPRLVSPTIAPNYEIDMSRVSSGVAALDEMLDGGFWLGSTTLLAGPTGSGKTTLGLQFSLHGVAQGEPSLYVNFQENPTQTVRMLTTLGVDVAKARRDGLHFLYASPVELRIDSLVVEVFALVRERGIRRIVIDALGDLIAATPDRQRLHDYLYALVQHFTVRGVTTILTFETGNFDAMMSELQKSNFSYLSDNMLLLQVREVGDHITRSLRIIKARGTAHDTRVRRLEITSSGVRLT